MRRPACFNSDEQFIAWMHAARQGANKIDYCADCTQEYQYQMIRQYRCEHPGVTFGRDSDGFTCGIRPTKEERR